MIQEADPYVGTRVIMVAGLDDPRAIFLECRQGFLRRTNDRNVSGHMFVRIRNNTSTRFPWFASRWASRISETLCHPNF